MTVVIALATMSGLTLILTSLLYLANRTLRVDEDPRIDTVAAELPGNNCGACGRPGCRAFAEDLVAGQAEPAACTIALPMEKSAIADMLGIDVGHVERLTARIACAGGTNVARQRAHYAGPPTCLEAAQVSGGGKDCLWGCLGWGDCAEVCDFEAIRINEHSLPVVSSGLCTACGDCVDVCPKDLISLQPLRQSLWVRCRNLELGDQVLDACEVACTGCGKCARDAPDNTIHMDHGLPILDPMGLVQFSDAVTRTAIESCPTGAIVWYMPDDTEIHGSASRNVIRQSARADAPNAINTVSR